MNTLNRRKFLSSSALFERLVQGLVQILNRVVLDFWRNDTIGKGELSPVSEDLVNEN